jgi:hypothetical protein
VPLNPPSSSSGGGVTYLAEKQGVACTLFDLTTYGSNQTLGANVAFGCRVAIPATGTLHDLSVLVSNQAGNIDVGIYSNAAEPRAKLYSSGSMACPAQGWQIVADPALAVTQGEIVDFVVATDDATMRLFNTFASDVFVATLPSAAFWPVPNGSARVLWNKTASFPLPSTFADSALSRTNLTMAMMARIV